jgi:hypothetical protein
MVLPQPFTTAQPAIASFSYEDIISGTGVVQFFGAQEADDAGDDYILTTNALYSNDTAISGTMNNGAAAQLFDLDFDVTMAANRTIAGDVFVNATCGINGAANNKRCYIIAKLRKWDGSTETEIASEQSETFHDSTGGNKSHTFLVRISGAEGTRILKGEVLRMTIEVWAWADGAAQTCVFYHDPQDRAAPTATTTSKLIIDIPFEIEQ